MCVHQQNGTWNDEAQMLLGAGTCFIAPGRQAWGWTAALSIRPAAAVAAGVWRLKLGGALGGSTAPPPGTLEPIKLVNSVDTEALEGR